MVITGEKRQECIEFCQAKGYNVTDRDIAFILLASMFKSANTAFDMLYGDALKTTWQVYNNSPHIRTAKDYIKNYWGVGADMLENCIGGIEIGNDGVDIDVINNEISFEDNRNALVKYLSDIQHLMAIKRIDPKDGLKLMTDIRLKLNDKFNVKEQQVEQRIVVQPKFSHICDHTHKECWLQTEQFAMQHWHLIKDPNYKEQGQ